MGFKTQVPLELKVLKFMVLHLTKSSVYSSP